MSRTYIVNEVEQEKGQIKAGVCFVFTENRFNQVLMFKNQFDAWEWCKNATRWTNEKIKKNIVFPTGGTALFTSIIPPTN